MTETCCWPTGLTTSPDEGKKETNEWGTGRPKPEERAERPSHNTGSGDAFSDPTPRHRPEKKKTDKLDFMKI